MPTLAPASASKIAVAAPIPREPPVTRAFLPRREIIVGRGRGVGGSRDQGRRAEISESALDPSIPRPLDPGPSQLPLDCLTNRVLHAEMDFLGAIRPVRRHDDDVVG